MRRPLLPVACWLVMASLLGGEEPLPEYRRVRDIKATIRIEGSPTVGLVCEAMARPLEKLYPDLRIERIASGAEAAMEALITGRCDLAAMGHLADEETLAKFRGKFGYDPTPVVVAFEEGGALVGEVDAQLALRNRGVDVGGGAHDLVAVGAFSDLLEVELGRLDDLGHRHPRTVRRRAGTDDLESCGDAAIHLDVEFRSFR